MTKSCLYICQNAIGDVITSLPSIHFMNFLGFEVDILINNDISDIFSSDPNIKNTHKASPEWFDENYPLSDAEINFEQFYQFNQYDLIIDSYSIQNTKKIVKKIQHLTATGIQFDSIEETYSRFVSQEIWQSWGDGKRNVSDCFADLIRASGYDYKNSYPSLFISASSDKYASEWFLKNRINPRKAIAINPGAGNDLKKYPIDSFIKLSELLQNGGYEPFFTFGPREFDLFESIKTRIKNYHLSGISNIQDIGAILKSVLLVVSNDSALMHVGASVGTRTVGIFGPTKSKIWFPYSQPFNKIIEIDLECRKDCLNGCAERPCLNEILPEDVFAAIELMLLNNHEVT